jgi:hypothetical protein
MIIEERFDDAKGYAVNRRAYNTLLTGKGTKNITMVHNTQHRKIEQHNTRLK